MTRTTTFMGLWSLALLVGCGGADPNKPPVRIEPAQAQNKPSVPANVPAPGSEGNSATPMTENGGAAGNAALPASLARHAESLALIAPDGFAVARIDFKALRESKFLSAFSQDLELLREANGRMDMFDDEFFTMLIQQTDFGFLAFSPNHEAAGPDSPPVAFTAQMRFSSEQAAQAFQTKTVGMNHLKPVDYQGEKYYLQDRLPNSPAVYFRGLDVFVASNHDTMKQLIEGKLPAPSPTLMQKIAQANVDAPIFLAGSLGPLKPMGGLIAAEMTEGMALPPELTQLPSQMQWGAIAIDLDGQTPIDIDLDMESEESAEQLRTVVSGLLQMANFQMSQQASELGLEGSAAESMALAQSMLKSIGVKREAMHVDLALGRSPAMDKLPAVITTAIDEARAAAEKMRELNNAKYIVLAMHNFRDTYTRFPPTNWTDDFPSEEGQALLSWRVAILPFLEHYGLHKEFNLEEPWDSEHNKPLIGEQGLDIYRTDAAPDPTTTTWKYLPNTPGNIILIGAGKGTAVPWTQPDVFTFDPADPLAALGEMPEEGFVVGFRDGRVSKLSAEQLKAALGGEPIEIPPVGAGERRPPAGELFLRESGPITVVEDNTGAVPEPVEQAKPRTWSDATGKFKIEATLVEVRGDKVVLKRADTGAEIILPLEKLSAADQSFVEEGQR